MGTAGGPQEKILFVLPAYNEELVVENNLREAHRCFEQTLAGYDWTLLVADNGSSDRTAEIADRLRQELPRLELWRSPLKGKGRALRSVWSEFEADIYAYMDADLAADLRHARELIAALGKADVAVGSRLAPESIVQRSLPREILSHGYSFLAKKIIGLKASDPQCGFKAARAAAVRSVLPFASHDGWFFDTEFLAFSERLGCRVIELPIEWRESRDPRRKSSVKILRTVCDDLVSLWRLRKKLREI